MVKIKYLILCLIGLLSVLTSCNHKSEKLYQSLPVVQEFEPVEYVFDWYETSKEEFQNMPEVMFIINSDDEFPEKNLMGLEELKESDIDFRKYTLLLGYFRLYGIVLGHRYSFAKDLEKDIFIFSMRFKMDRDLWGNPETENLFTYYRNAILVSKIPEDAEVEFIWSY